MEYAISFLHIKATRVTLLTDNLIHPVPASNSLFTRFLSFYIAIMKYVLVSGGVISGIGKGVIASSTGLLLKTIGLKICLQLKS